LLLLDNIDISKYKIFIHFHGYDASKLLFYKSYQKRIRKLLEHTNINPIFVAQNVKNRVERAIKKKLNGKVLYCGIKTGLFNPTNASVHNDTFIFLQVSSLVEKKGHIHTLRAFRLFIDNYANKCTYKKFKYIFTGDGNELNNILNEIKVLNLTSFIEYIGIVSPEKAVKLLNSADCFVHHSITPDDGNKEGIPTSIMEAMAMELPIISTWHSGIPELVENKVNGILVEEKNIYEYAKAMLDITNYPKRMSINRQKINSKFSYVIHNCELTKLYQS